jgi:5-methylthioadenosine/S-adenosylhomocysteine deaminase
MAESQKVAAECVKVHGSREVAVLQKYGLLNDRTILSHAIYVTPAEIKILADSQIGISHLPTSNTIHKSGIFPIWKFFSQGARGKISLGTDSVVSKSRMDILTEAYQARLTHLYKKRLKFGTLFKMMTINGASVAHMPNRGRVLPGFQADLCFWKLRDRGFVPYDENNPFTLLGNLITHNGRTVRDLMINGQFVIKNRRHLFVDESKLLDELQSKHMEMRKRISK